MTSIKKDNNGINTIAGLLNTDGSTVKPIKADPSTHLMDIDNNTTGSDNGGESAGRDSNFVTTLLAVSSLDGATPVALYVDSSGQLLIKST